MSTVKISRISDIIFMAVSCGLFNAMPLMIFLSPGEKRHIVIFLCPSVFNPVRYIQYASAYHILDEFSRHSMRLIIDCLSHDSAVVSSFFIYEIQCGMQNTYIGEIILFYVDRFDSCFYQFINLSEIKRVINSFTVNRVTEKPSGNSSFLISLVRLSDNVWCLNKDISVSRDGKRYRVTYHVFT